MKAKSPAQPDDMRPEYHFDNSTAVRSKYYRRVIREGENVAVLGPDVAKAFRNSAAVNEALRSLLPISATTRRLTRPASAPQTSSRQGVCRKGKLWSVKGRKELESLALLPWAARRRKELLESLDRLDEQVRELDRAVEEAGRARPEVALLRTHPGVGMVVALAFVLTVGPVERFSNSRKLVSYWGLNPRENSSGGRQRLGSISKQGNTMMRWLLVEAAQTAARLDPQLRRTYQRLKKQKTSAVAKVAVARRLAVRLFWMLRTRHNYTQLVHMSGSPSSAVVPPPAEPKV